MFEKVINTFSTFPRQFSTIRQKTFVLAIKRQTWYPQNEKFCGYLFLKAKSVDKSIGNGYNIMVLNEFEIRFVFLSEANNLIINCGFAAFTLNSELARQ